MLLFQKNESSKVGGAFLVISIPQFIINFICASAYAHKLWVFEITEKGALTQELVMK